VCIYRKREGNGKWEVFTFWSFDLCVGEKTFQNFVTIIEFQVKHKSFLVVAKKKENRF
jgi:hypothetical protein